MSNLPMDSSTLSPSSGTDPAQYLIDELLYRIRNEPELFDWIQTATLDGLWYWDLENMENEWMSPEFKALFGYTDDEVPNTSAWWQEHIFAEDKAKALVAYENHVTKGTPFDNVVRYRHKNGSTVWVRCRGVAKFNEHGVPVRMLGAHSDVTPLMKVQEELKQKEAVLDLLCSSSLDGFWDWDIKTGKEFATSRWKKSLGYDDDSQDIIGWKTLLHPDDLSKALDAMEMHIKEGKEYNVVLRYKRKNGTWAHMLSQGVAQKDEEGNWSRMFGTVTDVSHLEEARVAREANEAKSIFLATMSHEIRTPLNAVLGMAQVLLTTELTEEQEECVKILQNSGAHLLSLINDVLDFSQIESGQFTIAKESFSIQKTVVGVLDVFALQARQKGIALSFESQIPAGAKFTGDSERICQVLFNIIGNAMKFTSVGTVGVVLSTKVIRDELGVLMEINDTGCGMTEDQQQHIFDRFRQASTETRKRYGGSGLGLSISKKLTLAMRGTLRVRSELAKGSTFSVWLPGLCIDCPNDASPIANSSLRRVLLFEANSEATQHSSLMGSIKAAGCDVVHTDQEEQLKSAIETYQPDAVVVATNPLTRESVSAAACAILRDHMSAMVIVGIDRALCRFEPSSDIVRLPQFPTSDEFHEVFTTGKTKAPSTLAKHIDEVAAGSKLSPLRVLIAEDIVVNQKVLIKLLSRLPCTVAIANNGIEAVDMATKFPYDLILMDCVMPEMDGLEATRVIRESGLKMPIVALTANATTEDRKACLDAGCSDFLSKPVSFDLLCNTFAQVSKNLSPSAETENGHSKSGFFGQEGEVKE